MYPRGPRPQGGPGLDPAYLGLQLRKLQKKQKGLVKEVQAAAAREAFWKGTALTAEQAVDQVPCMPQLSCSDSLKQPVCTHSLHELLTCVLAAPLVLRHTGCDGSKCDKQDDHK